MRLTGARAAVFLPAVRPLAIVVFAALLVACKSPATPTVRPSATPVIVVDAGAVLVDASVDAAVAESDEEDSGPPPFASSWNDPAAIAQLARDCNAVSPSSVHGMGDGPDGLNCEDGITEQSCNYDPCHEDVDTPCRVTCGQTCSGCDARCRTSCRTCRAACHDDACIRACAVSCGRCLEGCIDERDHCMTAGCTARYEACALRAATAFRRGPCLPVCRRCTATCANVEDRMECVGRCLQRQRGCTAEQSNHCAWEGPEFGEELLASRRDAGVGDAR